MDLYARLFGMINQTQPSSNLPVEQSPYDALLVVSFGGPEGMDDVMPFLENVLRGRSVTLPRERLLAVAKHYELFGGVSPINQQNRNLIAALERELKAKGPQLPIYFGNRNWHPMLADTLDKMRADGIRQALAFVTSAYSSYSSCRQYLNDIERARQSVGPDAPRIEKLRAFHNHPGFIEANVDSVRTALEQIPEERRATTQVVFTAHSIPESMAVNCDYAAQLEETSRLVAAALSVEQWHARLPESQRLTFTALAWSRPLRIFERTGYGRETGRSDRSHWFRFRSHGDCLRFGY